MVTLVHEVWEYPENHSTAMFVRGSKGWRSTLSSQAFLVRTFEAESRFEAFRIHYRLMGWGAWSEPEGIEDQPYDGTEVPSDGMVERIAVPA